MALPKPSRKLEECDPGQENDLAVQSVTVKGLHDVAGCYFEKQIKKMLSRLMFLHHLSYSGLNHLKN